MLFKSNIPNELVKDEDKLVEQLYIFLGEFVRAKLKYEKFDNVQDCIQDTLLYILERVRKLTEEQLKSINLERFIYNRANSYVSAIWLRKLKKYRRSVFLESELKYSIERLGYTTSNGILDMLSRKNLITELDLYYKTQIDTQLIEDLIFDYRLSDDLKELVKYRVIETLISFGFTYQDFEVKQFKNHKYIEPTIHAVVDEYLINFLGGTHWKQLNSIQQTIHLL